jgi:septum formation protein
MKPLPAIWLASKSARRAELLRVAGVRFEVLEFPEVEETQRSGESATDYVKRVCLDKAVAGWRALQAQGREERPVLSSDTEVCVDEAVFGKPVDAADAARMLRLLSGREHRVLSAVAVKEGDRVETRLSMNRVRFRPLTEAEITAYAASLEPMGKAGGYAIQGPAAEFIPEIHGSYSGIMGLPLCETLELLRLFAR